MSEPDRPLTKRELRTLKNALGKQGITMEQHEAAQKLAEPAKILQIDCFALREREDQNPDQNPNLPDADGWYVGYGVAMNGVGRAEGVPDDSSEDSDDDDVAAPAEEGGESSGFESDPPTDEEEEEERRRHLEQRRDSDDVSDKGQLLYGLDHQFYVHKQLTAKNCDVHYIEKMAADQEDPVITTESFKTGDLVTTMRYPCASSTEHTANTDDEMPHGYQMIGDGSIPCATSHSEEESGSDGYEDLEDVTTSAGLWCNFVITPDGFEGVKKETLSEEKLKTIPLDAEKLAQISAAMAGLKLPTPPGWEGVSDEKLLDFIKQRV